MKILIVTHYFQPHIGGIEIVALNEASEFIKQGHEVTIVTSKLIDDLESYSLNNIKIKRVKAWNFLEKKFGIPYPIFSPQLFFVLKNEIKNNDLIHVHGAIYLGSVFAAAFSKLYKKPLITTEHVGIVIYKTVLFTKLQKLAFRSIGKFVLDSSNKVLVLNKIVKVYLLQITNTPIEFLFNGVNTDLFKPASPKKKLELRKKYGLPMNKKLVLFVGRFVQKKGIDILIQSKSNDFDLILVGKGILPENAESVKGLHVFNSLPQEKLAEIYQLADLFVLPSRNEGFPLSLQEAMASGLSILTTRENFNSNLDMNKFGLYIQLTSVDIKNKVNKLIKNNDLLSKYSTEARKTAVNEFSWAKYSTNLLSYFN